MIAAGVVIAFHESDLYVPVNDVTTAIVQRYKWRKNVVRFKEQGRNRMWYDIPFAYTPWWERNVSHLTRPGAHRR